MIMAEMNQMGASRVKPYLIARRDVVLPFSSAFKPLNFDGLVKDLTDDPAVTVEREITPSGLALLADTPDLLQRVVVARMTTEKAAAINLHPQVMVEEDAPVRPVTAPAPPRSVGAQDPTSFLPFGGSTTWTIHVTGSDNSPIAGATVFLYGAGVPAQGQTDGDGVVSLSLVNETDETVRAIYVNPRSGYWSLWLADPAISSATANTVALTPLSDTFPNFPDAQQVFWGQATMRMDRLDPSVTGKGIKVAVIDSGAATTHPDLVQINTGRDFTVLPAGDSGWQNDVIAHGSHCCGVIAGRNDVVGIRGFAPEADVRALRIFPGGRFSSLLDALDYCIEQQIDVVNMSLGSGGKSETMLQKLAQAKQAGVACIVAAGNSGDAVQFPGSSPDVLTVAALGKLGEFPSNSFHAQQVPPDVRTDRGYFSAAFTCHGPEVDVCAPGVAIVSSVPPQGYAAWDGTSMAAPHVTGLAALVLAHHPDFANDFRERTGRRVERLFQILKDSATPLDFGDPGRSGAGVPDAVRALTAQLPGAEGGVATGMNLDVSALLDGLRIEFEAAGLL
jgi:subtilisin